LKHESNIFRQQLWIQLLVCALGYDTTAPCLLYGQLVDWFNKNSVGFTFTVGVTVSFSVMIKVGVRVSVWCLFSVRLRFRLVFDKGTSWVN